jgi:hypothetical protein
MTDHSCIVCKRPLGDDDFLGFESESGEPWTEDDGTPVQIPHCGGCWCIDQVKKALSMWAEEQGMSYVSLHEDWDLDEEEDTDELVLPLLRGGDEDDEDATPAYQFELFDAAGMTMLQSVDPDHQRTWRIWVNRATEHGDLEAHALLQEGLQEDRSWSAAGYAHDVDALEGLKEQVFEALVARAAVPDTDAVKQLARLIEVW